MHAKNWALGATLLAGCMASGPATADLVSVSNVTATWFNPTIVSLDGWPHNVTYTGNGTADASAKWGRSTGSGQSGYRFQTQSANFTVPPAPTANQVIGQFTHINFPITDWYVDDIQLRISASVSIDGANQGTLDFIYGFDHWETPNQDNPCANREPNGSGVNFNGCADRVIATWQPSSDTFFVGDKEYTLNVEGFSLSADGSNPFTSFWTRESAYNVAYLVANVDLKENVDPGELPEPPALALLGVGLAGIGYARRRSRRRNSR